MRRYIQHDPFNIYCFESDTWEHPVHKHTYFEIIFILKGKGVHNINGNAFRYNQGDVFLLGPEDYHNFIIRSRTEFCYIRFMESFSRYNAADKDSSWQQTVKLLLHTPFQSKGSIVQDEAEKQRLHHLLLVLRSEYDNYRHYPSFELMRDSLMKSIMTMLARNLLKQDLPKPAPGSAISSVEEILVYIRQHIYKPDLMRLDQISKQFNYAPAYMSTYFKKHTGEPLKQYIIKYKLKLIETRLLYSQSSLTEIADEFGFTDQSHLCKQFRKYTGFSPNDFRSKNR